MHIIYIIIKKSHLITVGANITEYPSSQVVTSPSAATFNCTASGIPRPNITWTDPDGNTLMSGLNDISITTIIFGIRSLMSTLQVIMTSPSFSGKYTCNTDNGVLGQGGIISVNATLEVYGKK